jgi:hypothetical protein
VSRPNAVGRGDTEQIPADLPDPVAFLRSLLNPLFEVCIQFVQGFFCIVPLGDVPQYHGHECSAVAHPSGCGHVEEDA